VGQGEPGRWVGFDNMFLEKVVGKVLLRNVERFRMD